MWDKVLEPVAERRNETGSLKLFPVYLKGEDLFGLTVSAVTRIVESVSESQIMILRTYQVKNALMWHLEGMFKMYLWIWKEADQFKIEWKY